MLLWGRGRNGRASCRGTVVRARDERRRDSSARRPANALNANQSHDRRRETEVPVSDLPLKNMASPVTDDKVLTFDDLEDASDSESFSGSSSDSSTSIDHESGFSTKPESGANNPPLSRDELLTYLKNMRQQFSKKPTSDSFADQDEEVLVVTPKKRLGLVRHLSVPQLMRLVGTHRD